MKLRALVPLLTYPEPHTTAVVANAVAVTDLLGADLHALVLEADIPEVSNAFSRMLMNLPEMIRNAEKLSASNGAELLAAARVEAEARSLNLTTSVERTQVALLGEAAARHARYFDMALVGWNSDNPGIRALAEAVVFSSGRPTILLPDQAPPASFSRVSIAWDGTRVAARAVSDARFVLERAVEIKVVTVTDEKSIDEADAGERLAGSLREAGLKATFSAVRAEDCPIAETLQRHSAGLGSDLLVMGGYGHSRLRDFVLGGATEGVLADLRMPVLLSH
ncbi:universal stress protein [Mesorhizobium sp.]|uniref:universal stress protein n=1 Tax=Mesorhizobium sp. TaxID=1871066 RepID=UPI000FE2B174|nr:universal stress protein [Mesorhizobium sp.]RWN60543.1 MAG: universal stress protein [Mesorhizobium sp.]RWO02338.1 MAG: universal stress protein [Mesorhizobium sp.]RWO56862.1 MAG: universal stress protein [Mesorhizobium sp.]TIL95014.1 MAG: universal stress protein [Mesorhizobium sp.]TIN41119.1 MAG: universal stress protein [Mesorhizobium sp.]